MKGQKGFVLMVKRPFFGLFQRLSRWHALYCERQLLTSMSDDALKDIGLNRADVERESHRRFWEDPLRK
ncbi:DUF1127 domain-containing protein [Pseudomonas sp. ANT_H14]|uniref:DUF1127 domain-containing protein n=1 Tax=unclassified Pseudomonas TaxID=196821 RepID=UPI0011ED5117|nr:MULTISPECIES: DUF1127 domain-containing protein [unclassified Pseudomonas]KAA0943294.1 DUF1127 domain-containing protein [Pseudomonas sp. ANT_H4]KAA0949880.1 DUF1127 domain-containing protein [Pseudomonas sp. ANT_H14]